MVGLDAEDLTEAGIENPYDSRLVQFRRFISEPAAIQEFVDTDVPRYSVMYRAVEYTIDPPDIPPGQSWGRATYALFKIVNDQLINSEYRLYASNGGNDLGGMFFKASECDAARQSLPRREGWPYLPTLEHPW